MDKPKLRGHGPSQMPKSPRSLPNAVRVVDVLTYPAVQLLDVTGPVQVFASANDLLAQAGGARPYRLRVVAQYGEGVTASAGVALAAGPLTPAGETLDTLLIAGGEGAEAAAENPVLVASRLAQRYPAGRVEPDPIFVRDGHVWTSAGSGRNE